MPSWRLTVLIVAALHGRAAAHQSAIKYIDVTVDGARADIRVTVAPLDLTAPLGLPPDARPTPGQVLAPAGAAFVAGWLAIAGPTGQPCARSTPTIEPDVDGRLVIVRWHDTCETALDEVVLDLTVFFVIDARHEAIVTVHAPFAHAQPRVVRADRPRVVIRVGGSGSFGDWIALGMHHIYTGIDHVCFVLALLLAVVITRTDGGWRARPPFAALRAAAWLVTGFTIAHSTTLIAAALGWVSLPPRLVESAIAVSILYTAAETLIRPDARWRVGLAFGFGLLHGLGFASVLADQLPPTSVVVPLLGFNLGVELGQLIVVGVALPVLLAIARLIGGERYRLRFLSAAVTPLLAVSIWWLIDRLWS